MPTVSVIIPAYNAEPFVRDTVLSALNQTYTDLEVIVVDDGSKDGTVARLSEFGDRIRVHQQTNSGVSKARNAGVQLARGEWVAFLDADDLWAPNKLERQFAGLVAPMVYTNRTNIGARGDIPELQSECTPMEGGDLFVPLLLRGNFITLTTVMLKKELFERMNGFYSGLNGTEDWDLWLRIAESNPIAYCPEPLAQYRFHPAGLSRNYQRMNEERTFVTARALALARGRGLSWKTRRQIWAGTWYTNGSAAGRAGARTDALLGFARAVGSWPLNADFYKEALKVFVNV